MKKILENMYAIKISYAIMQGRTLKEGLYEKSSSERNAYKRSSDSSA